MKYDRITHGSLDYCLYRFGRSKTLFRGPRPDLSRPYCLFLGASETFGKFVPRPFTRLLQHKLDMPCANFAANHASAEFYLKDPSVLTASAEARVTVIAITSAQNISNRFYTVHPRHNDRFVAPSKILRTLYRDVEFTDIHYTGHLLRELAKADRVRFSIVVEEIKAAWLARMKSLLGQIEGKTILLWMSVRPPQDAEPEPELENNWETPAYIDQSMVDELSPLVTRVVECVASLSAVSSGVKGMMFDAGDRQAAQNLPNPAFHREVAEQLEKVLKPLI